ncbi:MAG: NAD(P)/FAD-dependent oxidoreductase [Planctomycetota bacterium]|jgi:flavin-dependent dehydrogenase
MIRPPRPVDARSPDVLITGAGPAGSALAARLAAAGAAVEVWERDRFPRPHIGESLLPIVVPELQALGFDLAQEPCALRKGGATFMDEGTDERCRFDFGFALDGTFPFAYQVDRPEFDRRLTEVASAAGATIRFAHPVLRFHEHADRVEVHGPEGSVSTKLLIDASGQAALSALQRGARSRIRGFGVAASFGAFPRRNTPAGNTLFEHGDVFILVRGARGWAWLIPLPDGEVSVGVVDTNPQAALSPESVVRQFLGESPFTADAVDASRPLRPFERASSYSFYHRNSTTPRTLAVGDACGFLDPVFSSGVAFAILGGALATPAILRSLEQGTPLDLGLAQAKIERAYTSFERVIARFYRPRWVHRTFFAPEKSDQLLREITSLLAGDVLREDNEFQNLMLAGSRRGVQIEEPRPPEEAPC